MSRKYSKPKFTPTPAPEFTPENYPREHAAYVDMLRKCYDPSHPEWKDQGARGITVSEAWQGENGFQNFMKDMGPIPKEGH